MITTIRVSHRTDRIKTRSPSGLTSGEDHAIIHGMLSFLRPVSSRRCRDCASVVVVVVLLEFSLCTRCWCQHEQREDAVIVCIVCVARRDHGKYAWNRAIWLGLRASLGSYCISTGSEVCAESNSLAVRHSPSIHQDFRFESSSSCETRQPAKAQRGRITNEILLAYPALLVKLLFLSVSDTASQTESSSHS